MRKQASFEQYIKDKQYNEIYRAIQNYTYQNKDRMNLSTYAVPEASRFDIDTFEVMGTTFKEGIGDALLFEISVSTNITISGKGKYDWEEDSVERWFRLGFEAVLLNGLNHIKLLKVEEYNKEKFKAENCLSKFLVPYIYAKDLDTVAERFLEKYCPEALLSSMPIPVDLIVQRMGLNKIEEIISEDRTIFGKTYFADTIADFYDEESGKLISIDIKAGTIVVDPDVFFMRNVGSLNNTIIHECVHWDKHRRFFELQKLFNEDIAAISCEVVKGKRDCGNCDPFEWMEWQANALTPRILLPAKMTKNKIENLLLEYHFTYTDMSESEMMEHTIERLAEFFHVSKVAAKLRAIELGYDQAEGTSVFMDDKYIPSYSFKQGSLQRNQTYTIDFKNALFLSSLSPEFANVVRNGNYIYVEGKYCINDNAYIEYDEAGSHLTPYAREHVDECCLKFSRKNMVNTHYDDSYYRQCFLCKNVSSECFVEADYINDEDNQDVDERARELAKVKEAGSWFSEIFKKLPSSFSGTLDAHITRKEMTNLELQGEALINERTIRELRKNEDQNADIITIMSLCIGLHLHPLFSDDMFQKSGVRFKPTEEHFFYRFLLNNHYMDSIDLCNEKLEEMGYHLLGKIKN